MKTALEVDKDGKALRVYHRTDGGQKAWTHLPGAPCPECDKEKR